MFCGCCFCFFLYFHSTHLTPSPSPSVRAYRVCVFIYTQCGNNGAAKVFLLLENHSLKRKKLPYPQPIGLVDIHSLTLLFCQSGQTHCESACAITVCGLFYAGGDKTAHLCMEEKKKYKHRLKKNKYKSSVSLKREKKIISGRAQETRV